MKVRNKLLRVTLALLFVVFTPSCLHAQNINQDIKLTENKVVFNVSLRTMLPHSSVKLEHTLSKLMFGQESSLTESFKHFTKPFSKAAYNADAKRTIVYYAKESFYNPNTGLLCIEFTCQGGASLADGVNPRHLTYDTKNDRLIELRDLISTALQTHLTNQGVNLDDANNIYCFGRSYVAYTSGQEIKMNVFKLYKHMTDYGLELVEKDRESLERYSGTPFEVDGKVFEIVEQNPSFPGGQEALSAWLRKNLKYPAVAQNLGVMGRAIVQFVVDIDGTIHDAEIFSGVEMDKSAPQPKKAKDKKAIENAQKALNYEALRVVSTMPDWDPGMQKGRFVRVRYTLPITFRLM